MNIFVTDVDPAISAHHLDDKRVIKMILESTQMLSTAINLSGGAGPYKTTHANHPCSVWVRASRGNYVWLLLHLNSLLAQYTLRYGKIHKCHEYFSTLFDGRVLMPQGPQTPFANCSPHKDMEVVEAYKLTMKEKWLADKRAPTWKNGTKPSWA